VSTVKPFSRQLAATAGESADSLATTAGVSLSAVDRYGIHQVLMNNTEWVKGDKSAFVSRHPLWNTIYRNKANFFEVDEKDFFLALNPVLQQQQSLEQGNSERIFLNARGVDVRGMIARRVGFYTSVVEHLERAPSFVQDRA